MMQVPFYNFTRLHNQEFHDEVLKRFSQIIKENSFSNPDAHYNKLFEQEFAEMQKAKHCILVANGTDALELSLEVLGVGAGDKVGIPGITFYATAEAVLNRGAIPVVIDVDPKTGLISTKSLTKMLKQTNLKAIIPVHIYGMPAPIEELECICRERGIAIVEDGAQAHGTILANGQPVGSTSNLTTFSFYPTKNIGAFGDAGAILTQDDNIAKKIISLRNHGRSASGIEFFGRNSRCDHLQAAVIHLKLQYFSEQSRRRQEVAASYIRGFKSQDITDITMPAENFLNNSSWHLFPILVKNKETKLHLKKFLEQGGISTSLFYERSMLEEKPLKDIMGENTHAGLFAERVLCLPIHPCLQEEELQSVITNVKDFFKL
ncbi:MAG: DegT/DnrJ/EryC1/StrS aminotransferase family protein [Oligoflexia bacterium]|nr:DegT/DnrJ/EryC1/StrS aminotransferase family protein [Oligoflexia bacterium]